MFADWLADRGGAQERSACKSLFAATQIYDRLVGCANGAERVTLALQAGISLREFSGRLNAASAKASENTSDNIAAALRVLAKYRDTAKPVLRAASTLAVAAVARSNLRALIEIYNEFAEPARPRGPEYPYFVDDLEAETRRSVYLFDDVFLDSDIFVAAVHADAPVLEWVYAVLFDRLPRARRLQLLFAAAECSEAVFLRALAACNDPARARTSATQAGLAPSELSRLLSVVLRREHFAAAALLLKDGARADSVLASTARLGRRAERWLRAQQN